MNPIPALQISLKNNKGFSLIEVMVALGIFSIGILAVASMQISAAQGNLSARLRTEAITYASQQMETLMSGTYASISTGSATAGEQDQIQYNLSWTVTEDTTLNTKTIALSATWTDRGSTQSTNLNYIKADLK